MPIDHLQAQARSGSWLAREQIRVLFADLRRQHPVDDHELGRQLVAADFPIESTYSKWLSKGRKKRSKAALEQAKENPAFRAIDAGMAANHIFRGTIDDQEELRIVLDVLGVEDPKALPRLWTLGRKAAAHPMPNGLDRRTTDALLQQAVELVPRTAMTKYISYGSDLLISPERIDARYTGWEVPESEIAEIIRISADRLEHLAQSGSDTVVFIEQTMLDGHVSGTPADVSFVFDQIDHLRNSGVAVRLVPTNRGYASYTGGVLGTSPVFLSGEVTQIETDAIPGTSGFEIKHRNLVSLSTEPGFSRSTSAGLQHAQGQSLTPVETDAALGDIKQALIQRAIDGQAVGNPTGVSVDEQIHATAEVYEYLVSEHLSGAMPWKYGLTGRAPSEFQERYGIPSRSLIEDAVAARLEAGAPPNQDQAQMLARTLERAPEFRAVLLEAPGGALIVDQVAERAQALAAVDPVRVRAAALEAGDRLRTQTDQLAIANGASLALEPFLHDPEHARKASELGPVAFARLLRQDHAARHGQDSRETSSRIVASRDFAARLFDAGSVRIHAQTSVPWLLLPTQQIRQHLSGDDLQPEEITEIAETYADARQRLIENQTPVVATIELKLLEAMSPQQLEELRELWAGFAGTSFDVEAIPTPDSSLERDLIAIGRPGDSTKMFVNELYRMHPQEGSARVTLEPQLAELRSDSASPADTLALAAAAGRGELPEASARIWPDRGPDTPEPGTARQPTPPTPDTLGSGASAPKPEPTRPERPVPTATAIHETEPERLMPANETYVEIPPDTDTPKAASNLLSRHSWEQRRPDLLANLDFPTPGDVNTGSPGLDRSPVQPLPSDPLDSAREGQGSRATKSPLPTPFGSASSSPDLQPVKPRALGTKIAREALARARNSADRTARHRSHVQQTTPARHNRQRERSGMGAPHEPAQSLESAATLRESGPKNPERNSIEDNRRPARPDPCPPSLAIEPPRLEPPSTLGLPSR